MQVGSKTYFQCFTGVFLFMLILRTVVICSRNIIACFSSEILSGSTQRLMYFMVETERCSMLNLVNKVLIYMLVREILLLNSVGVDCGKL